jgi:hypothetical protein
MVDAQIARRCQRHLDCELELRSGAHVRSAETVHLSSFRTLAKPHASTAAVRFDEVDAGCLDCTLEFHTGIVRNARPESPLKSFYGRQRESRSLCQLRLRPAEKAACGAKLFLRYQTKSPLDPKGIIVYDPFWIRRDHSS